MGKVVDAEGRVKGGEHAEGFKAEQGSDRICFAVGAYHLDKLWKTNVVGHLQISSPSFTTRCEQCSLRSTGFSLSFSALLFLHNL